MSLESAGTDGNISIDSLYECSANSSCESLKDLESYLSRDTTYSERSTVRTIAPTPSEWIRTDAVIQNAPAEQDFGALKKYGRPAMITLDFDQSSRTLRGTVEMYSHVPLDDIEACLDRQPAFKSTFNIVITLINCEPENLGLFQTAVRTITQSVSGGLQRCVLHMNPWTCVVEVSELLSLSFNTLFELNIGIANKRDASVPRRTGNTSMSEEAVLIQHALRTWLDRNQRTLRCLRIYSYINVDDNLVRATNPCRLLSHLTVSKLLQVEKLSVFPLLKSFEFDGQNLGYSEITILLSKHLTGIFPNCTTFGLRNTLVTPVVNYALRDLSFSTKNLHVYLSMEDLLATMKPYYRVLFTKIEVPDGEDQRRPNHVIAESRYTRIIVHGAFEAFISPCS